MSEFKRLERIIRSLIPRFPRNRDRYYSITDARNILNELGLHMSPEALAFMLAEDTRMDDFINAIYDLEARLGKKAVDESGNLDEGLDPKVYEEDGELGFSVTHRGKEYVFAEYELSEA
ncbi:MAG: hypothetical protein AAF804_08195 [Bacteroidota bacterium]